MKIHLPQSEAFNRISGCIFKIVDLETLNIESTEDSRFKGFELKTRNDLKEIFGEQSDEFIKFDEIKYEPTSKIIGLDDYPMEQQMKEAFFDGIGKAKELLLAVQSLLQTESPTYIRKEDPMTQNSSRKINIQGHGNIVNLGNGNVQSSIAIKTFFKGLEEKIDSSDCSQSEKFEAKGILEKLTSNPLLISILGNSIPELFKLFSNQS